MKLKSKIVAFLNERDRLTVKERLIRVGVYEDNIRILNKGLTQKEVLEPNSIWRRSVRYIQEQIGGGPAEFIKDVETMNNEQSLLVIETDNLNTSQIRQIKNMLEEFDLTGGKYFGQFTVEHITPGKNHRYEVPAVSINS